MENVTTKGFWDRPEGKTGLIFLALFIGLGGYAAFLALPFILGMLVTATQTAMLAIGLGIVGVVLMDKKFQLNVKAIYQISMKKMTGFVIELDPIAIIEGYLETLQESLGKMSDQLNLLAGQESKLNKKITDNRNEITKSLSKATQAKAHLAGLSPETQEYREYQSAAVLGANKAGRLQESNHRLEEVLGKIVNLRKILEKMYSQAKFVLADMTDEVKIRKEESEGMQAGYNAFKSAMKILDGNPGEKERFDLSMELMADRMGNQIGEIERFMQNSGGFLTGMDLDKEMFDQKGMLMIDEWSAKGDQMFITSPKETANLSSNSFINTTTTTGSSKYL
jgi:hypothetical protein